MKTLGMCLKALVLVLLLSGSPVFGQIGDKQEEAALFKQAEAFVAAFDKGDAKTLAGFWTPNGIYRDQKDNETKGRPAIEKMLALFSPRTKV